MIERTHVARPTMRQRAPRAFTLVEVLVALTLCTIVLLSLHATSRLLIRQTRTVDAETRWMFAAEQTLAAIHDEIRSGSWPDVNDPTRGARIQVTNETITIRSGAAPHARAHPEEMCFRRVGDSLVVQRFDAGPSGVHSTSTVLGGVSRFSVQSEAWAVLVRLESIRGSVAERSCPVRAEVASAP